MLNLKQASKKIDKEKSAAKKQALGKKKKVALKLANRKGGRGERNPANPDFQKNLQRVRVFERRAGGDTLPPPPRARLERPPPDFFRKPKARATRRDRARRTHAARALTPPRPTPHVQAKNLKKSKRSGRISGRKN